MNATLSPTRRACCMLWVTITIARSSRRSPISCSMTCVERGSSAEHGSSISSTSGRVAIARAMQSRCCWPPESRSAGRVELVLDLVPQAGAPQRVLDQRLDDAAPRPLARLLAQRVGHVVEDRHRERVGLLEDHRHAAAQRRDLERRRRRCRRAGSSRRATRPASARSGGSASAAASSCRSPTGRSARGPRRGGSTATPA